MSVEASKGFIGIHQSFAETELGEILSTRVRYEKYKPVKVSNERWEELLGADVNNLAHLRLTYGLTRSMIHHLRAEQPDFLTPHEEDIIQVTALVHDWAEAITGDINYNDKTVENEAEELEHLSIILNNHYDGDATDLKELTLEAVGVLHAPDSKLGRLFNTIERVGYMRTALRAAEHVKDGTTEDCDSGLRWLYSDVFGNHMITLIERSGLYTPLRNYLLNQRDAILEAFRQITPETFLNYPIDQQQPRKDAFVSGLRAFEQMCKS